MYASHFLSKTCCPRQQLNQRPKQEEAEIRPPGGGTVAPVLGSGGHGDHPQHIRPQDVYPGNLLQHLKENNEYYPRCCLLLSKIQNLDKRYWKSFFKNF